MAGSQTLSRGLDALEFISGATDAPSIDSVAHHLDVHRSVAYRIIRTLEAHRLVDRDADGRLHPAVGLAVLARSVRVDVRSAAVDELGGLANQLGVTAFLVVRDGADAVTVESVEPVDTLVGVTYRPGNRHALDRGAPGLAISAARPACVGERPEIDQARHRGWAESTGEVIPGMASVAAPIRGHDAAICVVHLAGDGRDHLDLADHVVAAAHRIEGHLAAGLEPTITGAP